MTSRPYFAILLSTFFLSCNEGQGRMEAEGEELRRLAEKGSTVDRAEVRSWINIRGTIVSSAPSSFILSTSSGEVTVEMDDWDWYQEGRALKKGYEVVVTGRVDDDVLLNRTVEARSVFVRNIGTYYYASGSDEESLEVNTSYATPAPNYIDITGTVLDVTKDTISLGVESSTIAIDISGNPQGLERTDPIQIGDKLYIWGDLAKRGEKSLRAAGLIKLVRV